MLALLNTIVHVIRIMMLGLRISRPTRHVSPICNDENANLVTVSLSKQLLLFTFPRPSNLIKWLGPAVGQWAIKFISIMFVS